VIARVYIDLAGYLGMALIARTSLRITANSGNQATKRQLMQAMLEAIDESGLDFSDCHSAEDVKRSIRSRLRLPGLERITCHAVN